MGHPAFAGFARRVLPWDDRAYDECTKLSAIATLLPYHSQADTASTVDALNRMIEDVGEGRTIFFDIYTEAEKRDEPAKENTGLFFFRGRPNAPFAIIAPGGGFAYVSSVMKASPMRSRSAKQGSTPSC
jgi:hypothetical protein